MHGENRYIVQYSDNVINKDLPRLSVPVKSIIRQAIEKRLLIDPIKFGKPLRYSLKNCRSLRIGDYRVIYQISNDYTINILIIGHRKNCYE